MNGQGLLVYWGIIRKRLWIIALLLAVTEGTIMAVFLTAKPVYSASVRFMVTTPPLGDVDLYQSFRVPSSREEAGFARANFIEILRSGTVAWQTIESLGVAMRGGELSDRIDVEVSEDSEFNRLIVNADTAEEAVLLANGLMENALRYYGELRAASVTNSLSFISSQLEEAERGLEAAEKRLLQLQIENHMGDLDSEIGSLQTLIRMLRLERDQAEAKGNMGQVAAYDRLIAERERELQDLLHLSTEYAVIENTVKRAQSLYTLLLDKQTEAKLKENEARDAGFIQVVEPDSKPGHPSSPFNMKIIMMGAVGPLIAGVLLCFVLEYVERLRVFVPPDEVTAKVPG